MEVTYHFLRVYILPRIGNAQADCELKVLNWMWVSILLNGFVLSAVIIGVYIISLQQPRLKKASSGDSTVVLGSLLVVGYSSFWVLIVRQPVRPVVFLSFFRRVPGFGISEWMPYVLLGPFYLRGYHNQGAPTNVESDLPGQPGDACIKSGARV